MQDFTSAIDLGMTDEAPDRNSPYRLRSNAYYALREYTRAIADFSTMLAQIRELEQGSGIDLSTDFDYDLPGL
ncbi:MAG: hypothetical protein R2932_46510 [Caldilineaceae bacterium]